MYARITVSTIRRKGRPAQRLTSPPIVFAAGWDGYSPSLRYSDREDRMTINKFGVKEDLVITQLEVISRHGFRNKEV